MERYLAEAKEAIGSSEDKKELFGAVKNLAKALEETQNLRKNPKSRFKVISKPINGIAIALLKIWLQPRKRLHMLSC